MPENFFQRIGRYTTTIIKRLKYFYLINELQIKESGLNDENVPFIKLKEGLIYYGYPPSNIQKVLFQVMLRRKTKTTLDIQCIRVAFDIVFRFNEIKNREYYSAYKKGENILEVGAYTGFFVLYAANLIQPSGQVIAIEAMPDNFKILKKNINSNNFNNVKVINKASWDSQGSLTFQRQYRQRSSAKDDVVKKNFEITVSSDTIDNILADLNIEKIDFVRIQVNGAEIETLKGMEKTLENRPRLSIANIYSSSDKNGETVISFLHKLGYSIIHGSGNIYAYYE